MRFRLSRFFVPACAALALGAAPLALAVTVTLNRSFVQKYRHRVTMTGELLIDKAHDRPNSAAEDGDLHIAGRMQEAGLMTVAEIMNARGEAKALDMVHRLEGTGNSVRCTGVWRFWSEHGGREEHRQGAPLAPAANSGPDHIFEIHPVTRLGTRNRAVDLLPTLRPIPGYTPAEAKKAFTHYEGKRATISVNDDGTVSVDTVRAFYNYTKFRLVPDRKREAVVRDGRFLPGEIQTLGGQTVVPRLYVAFVKGSEPERALLRLRQGQAMTVLGIPRISLARIWWRITHPPAEGEETNDKLPYEIVIVGVYPTADDPA